MSGTGKSSLVSELIARGYRAVDVDQPGWSLHSPEGEWIWAEDRIRELLSTDTGDILFISGCASNQVKFYPHFDQILLLTAPRATLVQRLATRTTNAYGKDPAELADVLRYVETIEPRLRRAAGHVIDTTHSLDEVISNILSLVGELDAQE